MTPETTPRAAAAAPTEHDLVLSRDFAAPRELVFRAWTDCEHLSRWWGPKGFTLAHCRIDFRAGGRFHYCMCDPDGRDWWGLGVFREIVAPARIVYTDVFSDSEGNVKSPVDYGLSASHPVESLVTVTFEEHAGGTRLTVRHAIDPSVPEYQGAEQGWGEMFDRLGELVVPGRR